MIPTLTIIILSFNVRQLLDQCLKSLFQDPQSKNWQIIIVDNASSDDTIKFLTKHYPVKKLQNKNVKTPRSNHTKKQRHNQILLITSPKNLGFAAGNNLAITHIQAPYTLFLNPDTTVPKDTIPFILNYLKHHPHVGAATCKIMLPTGRLDDGCHRGFPTPWNAFCYFGGLNQLFPSVKLFSGYTLSYLDTNTPHEIDSLTGAFMMLPTRVGEQLNWWDQDYFWNGDDLDFCYRIKQAGYSVMYLPKVQITHYKGASSGYKSDSHGKNKVAPEIKLMAARSSTQAMKLFYRKHYQQKYPTWFSHLVLSGIKLLESHRLNRQNNES